MQQVQSKNEKMGLNFLSEMLHSNKVLKYLHLWPRKRKHASQCTTSSSALAFSILCFSLPHSITLQ